ncbi:MAG: recombinase family protein [Chthoniobacterales bacterium]|nr:recombinase family protein [Chthoniobacterales bacterium]
MPVQPFHSLPSDAHLFRACVVRATATPLREGYGQRTPQIETLNMLHDKQQGFRSLQEAIDTTTPTGKLFFHIFGALAEFERDVIRERTNAGLEAARARGRHSGRPTVMDDRKLKLALAMHRDRQTPAAEICRTLGISKATFYRSVQAGMPQAAE